MTEAHMDEIHIRNLMVRGIVGINPEERRNRQDILINAILYADMRRPGESDDIADTVNYRTVAKRFIDHIETGAPQLVEHLAAHLVKLSFGTDPRIEAVRLTVEKPGALRFAESVGISIYRTRAEVIGA